MINAERAAFHAPDFVVNLRNVRKLQLKEFIDEYQPEAKHHKVTKRVGSAVKLVRNKAKGSISLHSSGATQVSQTFEVKYKPIADGAFLESLIVEITSTDLICKYVDYLSHPQIN